MRNIHVTFILIFIMFVFTLFNCAGTAINLDTSYKKYDAARSQLNILIEQYIPIQHIVSDTDHMNIKKAFKTADEILDFWESMLGKESYNYTNDYKKWLEIKSSIIEILERYAGDK